MLKGSVQEIVPFLKWAGGKRWLVRDYSPMFALGLAERYIEPFLGGGAAFFKLKPSGAVLNDVNSELIETYQAIRDDWEAVVVKLRKHQLLHDEIHYYNVRASKPTSSAGKAAKFIYLNRTCFNGLYRVNRSGAFNVPIGTKQSVLLESDNFNEISRLLMGTSLVSMDFESVINIAGTGDFVFADPPYTVKHNTNGFIKYNETLFSWRDQERLRDALFRAHERGARILLTNADHPSLKELYKGCDIKVVERHSVMASESARRKRTTEIVVVL